MNLELNKLINKMMKKRFTQIKSKFKGKKSQLSSDEEDHGEIVLPLKSKLTAHARAVGKMM